MVFPLADQLAATEGKAAARALEAEIWPGRPPDREAPVDQARAVAFHRAVQSRFADNYAKIATDAGREAADLILERRMSPRARRLLSNAPWPVAAWLLGQAIRQNAWYFVGSGRLDLPGRLELELHDVPLLVGDDPALACRFHVALFERLFQRVVDERLRCYEGMLGRPAASCRIALYAEEIG